MAKLNPNAQFIFFHGTEDQNTPILKIESFVEANKASKLPLKLELKKYQAGHYLNAQAIKDIGKLFQIEIKI
jgi:soluble cytochrome b562